MRLQNILLFENSIKGGLQIPIGSPEFIHHLFGPLKVFRPSILNYKK